MRVDRARRRTWSSSQRPSILSGKNKPEKALFLEIGPSFIFPIRRRHLDTVPQMAMAVVKLNQKGDISEGVSDTIQYFLDRLYINRSGQRTISGFTLLTIPGLALFQKLIGTYELRNRDPIGTQHFMK